MPKEKLPPLLYRVHRGDREPEFFANSGDLRWDPPSSATTLFGTCYMSTSPVTALMESADDLTLTDETLAARNLAELEVAVEQRLADMTNPVIVGEWGLDRRISVGDDYDVCHRWAHALRLAGFTGVYYEARHHPHGFSAGLFGDPGYQPTQVRIIDDGPIPASVVADAMTTCGLRVLPSVPLP
ncbi:MAG: RES family NAD+ phosphorylase [Acidimicrobiales bacterium]